MKRILFALPLILGLGACDLGRRALSSGTVRESSRQELCTATPSDLVRGLRIEVNPEGALVLKGVKLASGHGKEKRGRIKGLIYLQHKGSTQEAWVKFDCKDAADGSQICLPACQQTVGTNRDLEHCQPITDKPVAINIERAGALSLYSVIFENKDGGPELSTLESESCISRSAERSVDEVLFPSLDWITPPRGV